jgi:PAS domain S-box-containing protein
MSESAEARIDQHDRDVLLDAISEALIRLNAGFRITYANQAAEVLLRTPRSQLVGRTLWDVNPDLMATEVEAFYRRAMRERIPIHFEASCKLSGAVCDVHLYPDSSGGVSVLIQDISHRKQQEEELKRVIESERAARKALALSQAKYRAMGETLPYGLWMTSPDGTILHVSQSYLDLMGLDEATFKSGGWQERIPLGDRERILTAWECALQTGEPWDNEHRVMGADGKLHWVMARGVQVRNPDGEVAGWIGINLDIDERKRQESLLRQHADDLLRVNQDLENFVYAASHDLQEPLRVILSYSELLFQRNSETFDQDSRELATSVMNRTKRMQQFLRDLLEYATLSNAQVERMEDTPLQSAVDAAVSNLQQLVSDTNATITCDALPCVRCNYQGMVRVFQNFIANALKYRGVDPPRVHICRRQDRGEWLFSVVDNGVGFDPKYASEIFGAFRRLSSGSEGAGIGLAMVKRIIERHGGSVWAESEPGQGAKFFFTLPA